jgi:hypothetical protein
MITLHGIGITKGVGIAEAVVLSQDGNYDSIPSELLQRGLTAIRRNQPATDLPVVIVICSSLAEGLQFKFPGLRVTGIVAESEEIVTSGVPSVVGVDQLLDSVKSGDIVIVDGAHGIVSVDPDAGTVMHYQELETHAKTRRLFLESAHLPAVTQDGRTVLTLATVTQVVDADDALREGADGLLLTPSAVNLFSSQDWSQLLAESGGKQIILLLAPEPDALRSIVSFALPYQITIALPAADMESLPLLSALVTEISSELAEQDVDPAEIAFGVMAGTTSLLDFASAQVPISRVLVDARTCDMSDTQTELAECVSEMLVSGHGQPADQPDPIPPITVILASSIDSVRYLTLDGADSVSVPPGLVSATKDLIRSIPAVDNAV